MHYVLRDYDNAWSERRNAGDDGIRLEILLSNSEDSDDSDDYVTMKATTLRRHAF